MENEIWKPVLGYEENYFVSNKGRVKNKKGYIMKPLNNAKGYLRAQLSFGKPTKKFIHRMVWESFNGSIPEGMQINHLNEIKSDNRLENLSLCTPKENTNYGTCIARRAKKFSKPVIQLDKNGKFIKEWPSSNEIQRQLGYSASRIRSCCCNFIHSAHGFIWKHKENPEIL